MGFEVHITRKENWFEEEGPVISLGEWLQYVAQDPEMRHDGFAEIQAPDGSVIRMEGSGIAVWTAYSGHGVGGNMAWFSHFGDHVTVKNPDQEILVKMYCIASALLAKVQGDEGETYAADSTSESYDASIEEIKPWWRFW